MTTEIRVKRGTAAAWTSANPTLGPGEFGYETDTGALKVGDGSTTWTSLDYFLGQAVSTTSSVTFADVQITTASPSANSAVTKNYVDAVAAGLNWHESVRLATTGPLSGSPVYDNGVNNDGIGATLTAVSNGRLQVDGTNAITGDRILVKNQVNIGENGIYDVTDQGSISTPYVITRSSDLDGSAGRTIEGGEAVYVYTGTTNIGQGFVLTLPVPVINGSSNFEFTQFTGTSAITAGNGLTISGNTIDVVTADSNRIVVNANNIDLGVVSQLNTTGSNGTSFVQSHTVDSYGRVTGTVTASVQDASTAQKGIARFNSDNFSVSSGSVSIVDASTSVKGIAQFNSSNFSVTGGSVSIANNGIALGTHTTGNYMSNVVAGNGIVISHTPGEGSTASISIDSVISSSSVGSSGTYFVSAVNTNSYGQVTSVTSADVQDASTSQKGIARFNSSQFSVSSGSVSIANNAIALATNTTGNYVAIVTGTPNQVNVSGSGSENASITLSLPQSIATDSTVNFYAVNASTSVSASTLSLTSSISAANGLIEANGNSSDGSSLLLKTMAANGALKLSSDYSMSNFSAIGNISMTNSSGTYATGIKFTRDSASVGIIAGPRLLITSAGTLSTLVAGGALGSALDASSSVVYFVQRHQTGSVGMVLSDYSGFGDGTANIFEVRDSSSSVRLSIGSASTNFRLNAESASISSASVNSASLSSASIVTASISSASVNSASISSASIVTASLSSASIANNLVVSGNLTVNGTTTTVNSTTITVDDPILTIGGDTAPTSDDNKDRGIEFRYHSGTAASVGFYGYDDSTSRFIFLTGATNTSEVFSGTNASVQVGSLQVVGSSGLADYINLTGDATSSSVNLITGSDSVTLVSSATFRGIVYSGTGGTNSGSVSYSGVTNTFSFSRAIASASLSSASITSASIVGPTLMTGSVGFSGSVSLPATTDWPEQYRAESSSVTLSLANHQYNVLEMTAGSGTSVITVPGDGVANFPVGSVIQIIRVGAGEVQVTASAGVTVNNAVGTRLRAQWSTATLRKRAANTWLLSGDLKV